ncbi:MAG: helix-turn-helix domain-containing protein [Ruminiclostridium sp.]|nr:helix-turn-helix domain-containing protein [Ruminiclostridium sp.]
MISTKECKIAYMGEMTAVYEETEEKLSIGNHFHNTYELIYIIEGRASVEINSKKYEAVPGSLIFISHLESHELEILQYPYKRFYLLIKPQLFQNIIIDPRLSSIFKHRPDDFSHVIQLNEGEDSTITSLFARLREELDSGLDFSLMGASALLQLLFIRLYRSYRESFPLTDLSRPTSAIHHVQKYIDEHFLEPVTLKEVSRIFFIDMYYLSRRFKKVCGYSFKEYLILQRLSRAKYLLVESSLSITDICTATGFNNINNFIRIFKKNERESPFQYRKKYK